MYVTLRISKEDKDKDNDSGFVESNLAPFIVKSLFYPLRYSSTNLEALLIKTSLPVEK